MSFDSRVQIVYDAGRELYTSDEIVLACVRHMVSWHGIFPGFEPVPAPGSGFCERCQDHHSPPASLQEFAVSGGCSQNKWILQRARDLADTGSFFYDTDACGKLLDAVAASAPKLAFHAEISDSDAGSAIRLWYADGRATHVQTSRKEVVWSDRKPISIASSPSVDAVAASDVVASAASAAAST